jgi:tetratricopeptide (TPR) repeat protein
MPLVLAFQLQAQDAGSYEGPDYTGLKPVRLEIIQQSGPMGARFVHPTREGIEIEMLEGDGAIMVGWDHMDQFQINLPMTESLNRALSHQDPAKRVKLLRPEIEPLLPMASIKPGSTNIHILINKYIKSSIQAEDWLAAYDMSQKMALDRSPSGIVKNYYTVAVNLFITGEREKALKLLDQLVAARPIEESRAQTMQVAQRLLDERLFEPALRLFKSSAVGASDLTGKKVVLRCAYLCLELNDAEEFERYMAQAKGINADDAETRGILQLVLGVQAFQSGDPSRALLHLGHALAEVAPDSSFKQVGLYFNFLSYSNLSNEKIAQNILDEMSLLFPSGAYTALLTETSETPKRDAIESQSL